MVAEAGLGKLTMAEADQGKFVVVTKRVSVDCM